MSPWHVRLKGTADALRELPRVLPTSCALVVEEGGETYLESALFVESTKAEQLMAVAERLLDAANSVATLHVPGWRAVSCDSAVRLREDGTRLHVKLITTKIASSATLTACPTVVRADGTIEPPAQPPQYNAEATLVLENDSLRLVLSFLREDSWVNLYKAYEIVREAVGGEKRLRELRWVSDSLLTRFTRTCQSPKAIGAEARHGIEVGASPSKPLSHSNAKRIVADLIEAWEKHLLEGRDDC